MLQSKTHFEQIPLEVVKKIVEEQIQQEEAAEAALRERLQILARDAGEQSERPVAFNDLLHLMWCSCHRFSGQNNYRLSGISPNLSGVRRAGSGDLE
jgi:hypothetical protein